MNSEPCFKILFVCTANLCRSQLAEVRFRRYLVSGSVVAVRSAGTHAIEGATIPRWFAPVFEGTSSQALTARQATSAGLADADLVLTMTRAQRADVVQILPRCVTYTYTLTQFVDIAEVALREDSCLGASIAHQVEPGLLLDAVRGARVSQRSHVARADIPDPAHGGLRRLRRVERTISDSVDRLATAFQIRSLVESSSVQRRAVARRPAVDTVS